MESLLGPLTKEMGDIWKTNGLYKQESTDIQMIFDHYWKNKAE